MYPWWLFLLYVKSEVGRTNNPSRTKGDVMSKYLRMLEIFKLARKKGYSKKKSADIAYFAEEYLNKHKVD